MSAESKDPDEIITATFPFAGELGAAELSSVDYVTISVVNGADVDKDAMLNGAGVIVGDDVLQSVQLGVDAVDYKIRCRAVLSDGRKLVRALTIPVRRQ